MSEQHYIVRLPVGREDYQFYSHEFLRDFTQGEFSYRIASIYTKNEANAVVKSLPEGQKELAEIFLVGME